MPDSGHHSTAVTLHSSNVSVESLIDSDPDTPLPHQPPDKDAYVSPSILLNPLPVKEIKAKRSFFSSSPPQSQPVVYSTSVPARPNLERTVSVVSQAVSTTSFSTCGGSDYQSVVGSVQGGLGGSGKILFAPLPPGRSRFRSNSLTIGVAARAKMIASQGCGSQRAQPRYAGPQQWYHPGAQVPDDVYTYKDAAAAMKKVWTKVRTKSSSSSSSGKLAAVLASEKEGKDNEHDEMIEDVIHEHDSEGVEELMTVGDESPSFTGLSMSDNGSSVDSMSAEEPTTPPSELISDLPLFNITNEKLKERALHIEHS